jgi:hypothetical protein
MATVTKTTYAHLRAEWYYIGDNLSLVRKVYLGFLVNRQSNVMTRLTMFVQAV